MGHVVGWVSVTSHRGVHRQTLCGTVAFKQAGALRDAATKEKRGSILQKCATEFEIFRVFAAVFVEVSLVEYDAVWKGRLLTLWRLLHKSFHSYF